MCENGSSELPGFEEYTMKAIVCLLTIALVPQVAAAQMPAPVPAPKPAPAVGPMAPVPPVPPRPVAPRVKVATPMEISADGLVIFPDILIDVDGIRAKALALADEAAQRSGEESQQVAEKIQRATEQAQRQAEQAQRQADQARRDVELKMNTDFVFRSADDGSANGQYSAGLNALQARQYDRAVTMFDRVTAQKGARADGALYWKAFAQFKLGHTDEAIATIGQLRRDFPQSRYLNDARVLEADARKASGQPVNPASLDDDEIKLLAIQGIQKSDQAVPLLEGVLNATNSLAVKKRALYVLALAEDARAHQILMRFAKGAGNPDLQIESIRLLVARRDKQTSSSELKDIYESSQDATVRLAVIDAYRSMGDKPALVRVISDRSGVPAVRGRAISSLSGLASPQDLMALYQQETDPALRTQIVGVLGSMGAADSLLQIAKTDKDAAVRQRAIRGIGSSKDGGSSASLVDLYGTASDDGTKRAVISALASQNNADALVALARKETALELKKEIVRRISDLAPSSKVAADFLMGVLK